MLFTAIVIILIPPVRGFPIAHEGEWLEAVEDIGLQALRRESRRAWFIATFFYENEMFKFSVALKNVIIQCS